MSLLYRLLGALVGVVAIAAAGYGVGRMHQRALQAEKRTEATVTAIERHDQAVDAGREVEAKVLTKVKRADAYFAGLKREKPHAETIADPAGCRLDPDRLRLWAAANAGPEADAAAAPDHPGRSAATASGRLAAGPLHQPPGGDAPLLAHARAVPGADRLAGEDR